MHSESEIKSSLNLFIFFHFKHAFDANNLLGLVYKIVKDKQEAIPSNYSSQLCSLVQ